MNVTIQPENILRASWEVARRLPRTRMHTRQDWMSEAYMELRKRMGKAYWSSVNWTRATLRRRNFHRIQPESEADQPTLYQVNPTDTRRTGPLELNIAHELDEILYDLIDDKEAYLTLRDLDLTPKQKAEIIGGGVERPTGHNRIRALRKQLARKATKRYPDLLPRETVSRFS